MNVVDYEKIILELREENKKLKEEIRRLDSYKILNT